MDGCAATTVGGRGPVSTSNVGEKDELRYKRDQGVTCRASPLQYVVAVGDLDVARGHGPLAASGAPSCAAGDDRCAPLSEDQW